ncbi:MAG: hypothetical protein PHI14_01600 [Bacteroidales bacterium]|nr:hypothetical protein [Bacteroidales bacterium]
MAFGDIIINAHTHNVNDGKYPPTVGGDKVPKGVIGIVFDYQKGGGNTYIYNNNTRFRDKSSMKTEKFLDHFTTPDGRKL